VKILMINGPNINMLGIREKDIYSNRTYEDLINFISDYCAKKNIEVELFQSNYEGEIVDKIQSAYDVFDGIVINAAAYTHTSIAILDALRAVALPAVEVHISDIRTREDFRKISYMCLACIDTIQGHGFDGYIMAIECLCKQKRENSNLKTEQDPLIRTTFQ